MERTERRLVGLTLFSLILLTISVLVVFTGYDAPYGYNIKLIFGLILWPPALITFSGCLWLMLSLQRRNAFSIGLTIGVICLVGTVASVLFLKSYSYNGHADWGVNQGLLSAVAFASISMVVAVWMISKLLDEQRLSPRVYMFSLGIAVLVGFLLSLFFLWTLVEFNSDRRGSRINMGLGVRSESDFRPFKSYEGRQSCRGFPFSVRYRAIVNLSHTILLCLVFLLMELAVFTDRLRVLRPQL
jgi:hypothetical protein